jgi:hypothetical protein
MRTQKETDLLDLLTDIVNDFETSGCEDCGTVSITTINKARKVLGFEPLETSEEI